MNKLDNLDKGIPYRFQSGEQAAAAGKKGGSSPKRKLTLDTKRIMNKLLTSRPVMSDKLKGQLSNIGVDVSDEELQTNASLLSATILQKALSGDMDAIKMAFEMAGQAVTARDQADKQKVEIEKKKLKLIENGGPAAADIPVIRIEAVPVPEQNEEGE